MYTQWRERIWELEPQPLLTAREYLNQISAQWDEALGPLISSSSSRKRRVNDARGSGLMDINYVFAGLVVANRDEATAWYERLFGRPPDFLPNDAEAVWQLAATGSAYLVADADRAGRGIMALVVDDLNASLAEIASRGIEVGAIEEIPGSGRKSVIIDPDGNAVSMLEILASP